MTLARLLCSVGVAAVLLLQPAAALAAPTPSPGLDGILLKPPGTGYKEETKTAVGVLEGPFDAAKYAVATGAKDGTQMTQALTRDGFVSGYGRTWFSAGSAHVWVMAVIAFTGAQGAKTFLKESEAADKGDVNYSQALTIAAIDTYYGARLIDKVHKVYGDVFGFVKGNDVLLVTFVSNKNDLATVAATQTKKQFDAAPPYTIPPAQWPESKVAASSPFAAFKTIGIIVGVLFILGLIGAGGFLFWSRRRPAQAIPLLDPPGFVSTTSVGLPAAVETPASVGVPAAVAVPAAAGAQAPDGPFVMSEDRRSWWDGVTWRDAEHEVPPAAQRSEDGQFWWDGEVWRPMPPNPFGS